MPPLPHDTIATIINEAGADDFGIAPADMAKDGGYFRQWIEKGYHGDMRYLERNLELRLDPRLLLPGAQSVIVVGLNYNQKENRSRPAIEKFKVANYAWGLDYHDILRRLLEKLRTSLQSIRPRLRGRICVDTAPFMDKYWAATAGLGWQGKHTNLVSRRFGSWLLLGALIIDHAVDKYDSPHPDHCGKCSACVDACPTGAIIDPYQLDATRCISYWTIESKKEAFPGHIRANLNGWVFGCDICLAACPFNRFQKRFAAKDFARLPEIDLIETGRIIDITEREFNLHFSRSPVARPGYRGILRNIAAAQSTK
jgi:epoxyqueuosine reductase